MLISEEVNGKHVFSHYQEDQENTKKYFYQMSCKNEHKLFHEDRNRYNDSNDHFQQQISTGRPKTH